MKKILFILVVLFNSVIYAQPGWQIQYTISQNYNLNFIETYSNNTLYSLGEHSAYPDTNQFGIFRTTNKGLNWNLISSSNMCYLKTIQFIDSLTAFAGGGFYQFYMTEDTYGKVILKTTTGGANWFFVFNISMTPGYLMDVSGISFVNINTGWACCKDGAILKTTNGGINFSYQNTSPYFKKSSISFIDSQTGWVTGDSGYVAKSSNGGTNWNIQQRVVTTNLNCIYFINSSEGYICGNNGVILKTINGGINWNTQTSGVVSNLNSIYFVNNQTGWTAGNDKIIGTTNSGVNWFIQYSNASANIQSIVFSDSLYGWSCGGKKIFNSTNGGITSVVPGNSTVPDEFKLYQNYPNPFNPSTIIKFTIPLSTRNVLGRDLVTIKVYGILGNEVATLVNEKLNPGTYEIPFSINQYTNNQIPSGIYFYKLNFGKNQQICKMIFLK